MRYMKPIDLYTYGRAVVDGQIKLQSGQWVRLGDDPRLSRFHSVRPSGAIWAFHGPRAAAQFLDVCATMRAEDKEREERQRMKGWACALAV